MKRILALFFISVIALPELFSQNFSLVLNVGVDPRLKDYSVGELCWEYRDQIAREAAPEKMAG